MSTSVQEDFSAVEGNPRRWRSVVAGETPPSFAAQFTPEQKPVFAAAVDCVQRGWSVLPVQDKVPSIGPAWQRVRLSLTDLTRHPWFGVGVLLGAPSGWLTDVDIDCDEANRVADLLLPHTGAIFGRPGAQSSHRLYIAHGSKTESFRGPSGGAATLLEIRSTGAQTVFPPSPHTLGRRAWLRREEPSLVDAAVLRRSVARLAAAAALARAWTKGSRHHQSLALAGAILRSGASLAATSEFVRSVCLAARDEEQEDRIRAVQTTYTALQGGRPATGFPTLAQTVDRDVARLALAWLGISQAVLLDAREPVAVPPYDFHYFYFRGKDWMASRRVQRLSLSQRGMLPALWASAMRLPGQLLPEAAAELAEAAECTPHQWLAEGPALLSACAKKVKGGWLLTEPFDLQREAQRMSAVMEGRRRGGRHSAQSRAVSYGSAQPNRRDRQ